MADLDWGVPYHIGIVVRDLDEAMTRYGGELGVELWRVRDLDGFRQPSRWHGEPLKDVRARIAFSGPRLPAIELVQPLGQAEWSATTFLRDHGEGAYHVGYWVDDLPAALERAAALGIGTELLSLEERSDGEPARGFAYLEPGPDGMRAELIASAGRVRTEAWIRTGVDTG